MKYTARISTGQYEYVEVTAGSVEDIRSEYDAIKQAFTSGEGLPQKEWNAWIDQYLSTGKPGSIDEWCIMDTRQQWMVNEVKKHYARNKNK